MDEAVCLAKILSPSDPEKFPRGAAEKPGTGETREVTLPEGTPVKLLLRNFLYSRKITPDQPVVLEVAEDVVIDGFVPWSAAAPWLPPNSRMRNPPADTAGLGSWHL